MQTNFKTTLTKEIGDFYSAIASDSGEWIVKGFIDIYKNIYTISVDTKVISKIIELMLFPVLVRFADKHSYKIVLSEHQNHYPDVSFISKDGARIALDLKSTYRINANRINGFTLGAFTGYFRDRKSSKNITFPYCEYSSHIVLGIIYSRNEESIDERKTYKINALKDIVSVVRDFEFIVQEKWRLATDRPGSGNTKNIGSITNLSELREGKGSFFEHGEKVFDDYWTNYLTKDMARAIDSPAPFKNLLDYFQWKKRGK
ncbi:MAG: restriction endonuclease [Planctomycetota bacterium]|nr:MAG: restriction endonuclease [Planctomycetota bacterium]